MRRYIVVDYIWNYNKIIPTKEIWLVPYYDKNDPLFFYLYDPKNDDNGSKIEDSNDSYLKVLDQYKIINASIDDRSLRNNIQIQIV